MTEPTYFSVLESPIGPLTLTSDGHALTAILFAQGAHPAPAHDGWHRDDARLADARAQLEQYFGGQRRDFQLTLAPRGTPFQQRVWAALRRIAFGSTVSYAELARAIGRPSAARAVGAANGRNPLPIIVPCHRVIGSDGSLTGFAGGIAVKRWLLDWEQSGPALRHGRRGMTGEAFPFVMGT